MTAPRPDPRLTVLIHTVSPGGVRRHIEDFVRRIDHDRFRVVGAFPAKEQTAYITDDMDDYHTFFAREGLTSHVVDTPSRLSPFRTLLAGFQLARIMRLVRPDVLHTHSSTAGIAGSVAMRLWHPALTLYTPHLPFFATRTGIERSIFALAERTLSQIYDHIIAVSRSEWEDLSVLFGARTSVLQVNQAVPYDLCRTHAATDTAPLARELNIPPDTGIILSLARFETQKDMPTLVEAAALLARKRSDFVILLAGDGELRPKMEAAVTRHRLADRVRFLGWRNDVRDLIELSSMVVLSTRREGLPYVLLEAMALKKPVVGSDVPGVRECVVHGQTGYLFPCGDALALAGHLETLLDNRKKCCAMGNSGREYCLTTFSPTGMITALEALYSTSGGSHDL